MIGFLEKKHSLILKIRWVAITLPQLLFVPLWAGFADIIFLHPYWKPAALWRAKRQIATKKHPLLQLQDATLLIVADVSLIQHAWRQRVPVELKLFKLYLHLLISTYFWRRSLKHTNHHCLCNWWVLWQPNKTTETSLGDEQDSGIHLTTENHLDAITGEG